MQDLRDQLRQDSQLLASLDPDSAAYTRLAARIDQRTAQLLDYEDQRERQQQVIQQALAEERRRRLESTERAIALGFVLVGGLITYNTWGSWWLLLGLAFLVVGLSGLFAKHPQVR